MPSDSRLGVKGVLLFEISAKTLDAALLLRDIVSCSTTDCLREGALLMDLGVRGERIVESAMLAEEKLRREGRRLIDFGRCGCSISIMV